MLLIKMQVSNETYH